MKTYTLIKQLETLPYFNQLLKSGVVPINWVDYKVIYEFHKSEIVRLTRKKGKCAKMQAKTNTAEEFGISERSVYAIIKRMES